MKKIFILFFLIISLHKIAAQTGMTVTAPRLYYEVVPRETGNVSFKVINDSKTNKLDVAVTLGDWNYDSLGNNMFYKAGELPQTCADWISTDAGNIFTLAPGESRVINVRMTVPSTLDPNINVRTAMLYLTQTNAVENTEKMVKESVRIGVKIFHRIPGNKNYKINFNSLSLDKKRNALKLNFSNASNTWVEGTIYSDLFNSSNGSQAKLQDISIYTLPGDQRFVYIPLRDDLQKGKYTATVMMDTGDKENLEVAELTFNYE
ncbi:fimbrial biogenesis chaperone [Haoranjiania flava]|uniref:fimbrial biogenesis chaperone n=1 Tax=Haoranjiania flava TaxID=1856322 RepID=UPI0036D306D0